MLLELNAVSKSFEGLAAVDAVTLAVPEGEILGLIGPNGSGKTTLFNLITGAVSPTSGRVVFAEADITAAPAHKRCWLGIARTFQLARPFAHMSLLDNVALGRLYGRDAVRSRSRAEAEARSILDTVGLPQRGSALAGSLNPVDRKRLDLARAVATKPRLLLLDELLAGLNPSEVPAALDMIRGIHALGITIILVEHLVKAVFGIAQRVAVLNAGELIAVGTPREVARDAGVIEAYLGKPVHDHGT
jgi:branched-chain amino acid transport system ATP-binding protein